MRIRNNIPYFIFELCCIVEIEFDVLEEGEEEDEEGIK